MIAITCYAVAILAASIATVETKRNASFRMAR